MAASDTPSVSALGFAGGFLVVLGFIVSLFTGFDTSYIAVTPVIQDLSFDTFRGFFIEYWYFAVALALLAMYGWSHMHGEGYNEIEFD
jgi:hypothetical protein